jgi:hypothetical protein
MAGCSSTTDNSNDSMLSSESTQFEVNSHYETVAVPEGGWTAEELEKTIRIDGKAIQIPFTIDSLGDAFDIDETTITFSSASKKASGNLTYNKEIVGAFSVEVDNIDELGQGKILILAFKPFKGDYSSLVYINGVTIGSGYDDVLEYLGKPTEITDANKNYYMHYRFEQYLLTFGIEEEMVNLIKIEEDK